MYVDIYIYNIYIYIYIYVYIYIYILIKAKTKTIRTSFKQLLSITIHSKSYYVGIYQEVNEVISS